jgi:LacI family transcriptional regulator
MKARPSAVIAMNDLVALGMMSAFHEQGVRIPDEISIVGIDDIQLSGFTFPTLTTIRQPYLQIAESAIERVCARMEDPMRASATIALDPTLVLRASTAARSAQLQPRSIPVSLFAAVGRQDPSVAGRRRSYSCRRR